MNEVGAATAEEKMNESTSSENVKEITIDKAVSDSEEVVVVKQSNTPILKQHHQISSGTSRDNASSSLKATKQNANSSNYDLQHSSI